MMYSQALISRSADKHTGPVPLTAKTWMQRLSQVDDSQTKQKSDIIIRQNNLRNKEINRSARFTHAMLLSLVMWSNKVWLWHETSYISFHLPIHHGWSVKHQSNYTLEFDQSKHIHQHACSQYDIKSIRLHACEWWDSCVLCMCFWWLVHSCI